MLTNTPLLAEGLKYNILTNNNYWFNDVVYVGEELFYGKPILVFAVENEFQLKLNPSYVAGYVEIPIGILMDTEGVKYESEEIDGSERDTHETVVPNALNIL